jgi:hypothetical protein
VSKTERVSEPQAKTRAELNPEGKEQACRGCYKPQNECPECFWNADKWVSLAEHKRLEGVLSDIRKHYEKFPCLGCSDWQEGKCNPYKGFVCAYQDYEQWLGVLLKKTQPQPKSDRAKNWDANLHDLPEALRKEVVNEIDRQETQPKTDKFRCDEFGNPNRSDACDQCPSNTECFEEEKRLRVQPKSEANNK